MNPETEQQHFSALLRSQTEYAWQTAFHKAKVALKILKIYLAVALVVLVLDLIVMIQGTDQPFLFTFMFSLVLCIPTAIVLIQATFETEKVVPWTGSNHGSFWVGSVVLAVLSLLSVTLGLSIYVWRNSKLLAAAEERFLAFQNEASAKASDAVLPLAFSGPPMRLVVPPPQVREKSEDRRASGARSLPKLVRGLENYYDELQSVLSARGSMMNATDYNEDEVRHAWAHGVSPQKFLSMAVRPRLDDSTCRIKFPALDYSFTPSGIETPSSHDVSSVISGADDSAALEPIESTLVDDLSGMDGPGMEPPSLEAESGHLVSVAARLRDVETLFEQGLISQEERERKRAAILGDL